jgi:hypothetical protein
MELIWRITAGSATGMMPRRRGRRRGAVLAAGRRRGSMTDTGRGTMSGKT